MWSFGGPGLRRMLKDGIPRLTNASTGMVLIGDASSSLILN